MSVVSTRYGNREVRLFETSARIPTWTEFQGLSSSSGIPVTYARAMGLPSVGVAIEFVSTTIASLPLHTYRGEDADKAKARESWQWRLLMEAPNPDFSSFDFVSDLSASVESCGNAFARKLKIPSRSEVLALYFIDPSEVIVRRDKQGRKVFEVGPPGNREELTSAQVLHIRGFTPRGGDVGVSRIAQYANAIGAGLAGQEFSGRFYANDATPASYLSVPGRLTRHQAQELMDTWNATHGGSGNAGKLGILFDGTELKVPGIPLKDAQFIESMAFSSEQIARIFLGPAASLLGEDKNMKTEEESLRFLNFALLPRLRRIESALFSDPDLFPENEGLYPQFHTDEYLRADAGTQAEVQHKQLQSGVLLVDEARAEMGRPPLPDGMGQIPQITPVGGAPNPVLTPPAPEE